jgi:transposase InsO family protein
MIDPVETYRAASAIAVKGRGRRVSQCPDADTVMHQLSAWITHYNEVHPHQALGYRSPREFIAALGSS